MHSYNVIKQQQQQQQQQRKKKEHVIPMQFAMQDRRIQFACGVIGTEAACLNKLKVIINPFTAMMSLENGQ